MWKKTNGKKKKKKTLINMKSHRDLDRYFQNKLFAWIKIMV